ncbi:MAG TPA: metal-dependent hydrolase [Panacibacter sp.]|nr:metal-dependent hydrolase [Panacibacter sp.]
MKLIYYGHACFAVEILGKTILFDPFIAGNPLAGHIDINSINADFIFISHGHGDHIADAVNIAKRTGAICVGSAEVAGWLQKQGVENVHPINHGGPVLFEFGTARGVNAVHSSSFPDGSYAGNPMGFVFITNAGSFYYSGDTALTLDMQLIPIWAKLDFAVLPIGSNFTMDVADAISAADLIQCHKIVGVHYNTFGLITIDTKQALEDFAAASKTLLLPGIGETVDI